MAEAGDSPADAPQLCGHCGENSPKYKCPGCLVRTCSLACATGHKEKTGCSGRRDRAAFVRRADYDANTMMSDYGLLQELTRDHALLRRDAEQLGIQAKGLRGPAAGSNGPPIAQLNRAQRNVVTRAKGERQVTIRYMSPGIKRHQQNKTIWQTSASRLVWTIELAVPEIAEPPNQWIESGFHDVCRLGDLWTRLLKAQPGDSVSAANAGDDGEAPRKRTRNDDSARIKLPSDDGKEYQFRSAIPLELHTAIAHVFGGIPPEELVWLIRVQDQPANRPTFCRIDPLQPLYTQLYYQTVLEFPTVYVYKQEPATWGAYAVTIEAPCTAVAAVGTCSGQDKEASDGHSDTPAAGPAAEPQLVQNDDVAE
ncbi:Box C/D snoRNA accumulation [Coemansia nantahalensis]|uniref:Box C/D snoRNA accumulation n=1 Tax=Coemansia nantahalensis TaxID=2789366 RepID=A0ACC1K4A5_9FUNG|nr:Box C/D snoRNA accumulation [Coemansia nantahalensis]KAJ2773003.1 Box C/D snoRNA accumulation [Coemansia nantahalensis]